MKCSSPVAIRADDIALCDLGQDPRSARPADHAGYSLDLGFGIAMVEIHGAWWEATSAIAAWSLPERVQKPSLLSPFGSLTIQVA
jgi:hypothetical protein